MPCISAEVAQLVEHQLPKLRVAGSSPVFRSSESQAVTIKSNCFFMVCVRGCAISKICKGLPCQVCRAALFYEQLYLVLLQCASFSLLDHLLAGIHVHFHPSVFLTSCFGTVICHRIAFAQSLHSFYLRRLCSARQQVRRNTLCTCLRQVEVFLHTLFGSTVFPSRIVGIAINSHIHVRILVQNIVCKFAQCRFSRCTQVGTTCFKQDTRVESHFYSLQPVVVSHLFYFGTFNLGSLFGSLIHFLSNQHSGTCTNSRTHGCTNCGTFSMAGNTSDDSPQSSTATTTYHTTFCSVVQTSTSAKYQASTQ